MQNFAFELLSFGAVAFFKKNTVTYRTTVFAIGVMQESEPGGGGMGGREGGMCENSVFVDGRGARTPPAIANPVFYAWTPWTVRGPSVDRCFFTRGRRGL